jgi:methionine--tRNA ligase beta chain
LQILHLAALSHLDIKSKANLHALRVDLNAVLRCAHAVQSLGHLADEPLWTGAETPLMHADVVEPGVRSAGGLPAVLDQAPHKVGHLFAMPPPDRDDELAPPAFTFPQDSAGGEGPAPVTEVSRLEIRVGKIVQVDGHPTLPKIFVEKIDLGEAEGPRTICSGLQGFLTKEDLLGKACLVLANLKPRDLEGTPSNGMVLCASNKDHSEVRLVSPPDGVAVGELVTFAGHASEPAEAGNRAVKSWKKVGGSFATDAGGVAWYMGADAPAKMNTSAGPCTAVIKNGPIS